jgi:hypothetical protein
MEVLADIDMAQQRKEKTVEVNNQKKNKQQTAYRYRRRQCIDYGRWMA